MELKDYWQIIRHRWKLVTLCLVAALAVAGFLTWQATPQYSSSARLFISTSQSDESTAYTGNLYATQKVTSYADLVTSRQLALRVSDALGGEADPDALRGQVSASVVPETVLLEISATDIDPTMARDIAQAYAEEMRSLIADLETPEGKQDAVIKASIVDNAQENDAPVSPQPVRNLGLAAVLGLLLGLGAAVVRELLDTSVSSAEDVASVTTAPILGNIFNDAAAKRDPGKELTEATPWAEAFRVLRTNMQYVEVDHNQKLVVMTSSLPGEGKTTAASALAISLAQAKNRVALVECDLRRPLLARRLGIDGAVGTTSVLIGKLTLDDALQTYQDSDLQVLACGPVPPNPSELLQSAAMEKLLGDLRERFDVVILDAPPLLPVTDAAVLAAQADGAVVVVRHGKTTKDQLEHAIERLDAVDAKTLGVVVNMSPAKKSTSSYGYGYGYGYGYAPETVPVNTRRARKEEKARLKAAKQSRR